MPTVYASIDEFYRQRKIADRIPDAESAYRDWDDDDCHSFRRMFLEVPGGVVLEGFHCVTCSLWVPYGCEKYLGVCLKRVSFCNEFLTVDALKTLEILQPDYKQHIENWQAVYCDAPPLPAHLEFAIGPDDRKEALAELYPGTKPEYWRYEFDRAREVWTTVLSHSAA